MTYGDGLSNIRLKNLVNFHYKNNALVSLAAKNYQNKDMAYLKLKI